MKEGTYFPDQTQTLRSILYLQWHNPESSKNWEFSITHLMAKLDLNWHGLVYDVFDWAWRLLVSTAETGWSKLLPWELEGGLYITWCVYILHDVYIYSIINFAKALNSESQFTQRIWIRECGGFSHILIFADITGGSAVHWLPCLLWGWIICIIFIEELFIYVRHFFP